MTLIKSELIERYKPDLEDTIASSVRIPIKEKRKLKQMVLELRKTLEETDSKRYSKIKEYCLVGGRIGKEYSVFAKKLLIEKEAEYLDEVIEYWVIKKDKKQIKYLTDPIFLHKYLKKLYVKPGEGGSDPWKPFPVSIKILCEEKDKIVFSTCYTDSLTLIYMDKETSKIIEKIPMK